MTRVKICGVTRREDARLAADLGAGAIGFVFARSPRRVTVAAAREIAAALPAGIERVGVFADADRDSIEAAVRAVPLDRVQLHGDEAPALATALAAHVTRALRDDAPGLESGIETWRRARADVEVLLDLRKGEPADRARLEALWRRAAALSRRFPGLQVWLSGGLDAGNVADAIVTARPAWVDVARGTESSPGVKDPTLLRAFLTAVAEAGSR